MQKLTLALLVSQALAAPVLDRRQFGALTDSPLSGLLPDLPLDDLPLVGGLSQETPVSALDRHHQAGPPTHDQPAEGSDKTPEDPSEEAADELFNKAFAEATAAAAGQNDAQTTKDLGDAVADVQATNPSESSSGPVNNNPLGGLTGGLGGGLRKRWSGGNEEPVAGHDDHSGHGQGGNYPEPAAFAIEGLLDSILTAPLALLPLAEGAAAEDQALGQAATDDDANVIGKRELVQPVNGLGGDNALEDLVATVIDLLTGIVPGSGGLNPLGQSAVPVSSPVALPVAVPNAAPVNAAPLGLLKRDGDPTGDAISTLAGPLSQIADTIGADGLAEKRSLPGNKTISGLLHSLIAPVGHKKNSTAHATEPMKSILKREAYGDDEGGDEDTDMGSDSDESYGQGNYPEPVAASFDTLIAGITNTVAGGVPGASEDSENAGHGHGHGRHSQGNEDEDEDDSDDGTDYTTPSSKGSSFKQAAGPVSSAPMEAGDDVEATEQADADASPTAVSAPSATPVNLTTVITPVNLTTAITPVSKPSSGISPSANLTSESLSAAEPTSEMSSSVEPISESAPTVDAASESTPTVDSSSESSPVVDSTTQSAAAIYPSPTAAPAPIQEDASTPTAEMNSTPAESTPVGSTGLEGAADALAL